MLKKPLSILIVLIIALVGVLTYRYTTPTTPSILIGTTTTQRVATASSSIPAAPQSKTPARAQAAAAATAQHATSTAQESTVACSTAEIRVPGATFTACVHPGMTVIDMMSALADEGRLSYAGSQYPGLGFFVEVINGQSAPEGSYWILYYNGKTSDFGASGLSVKAGDTIEWRIDKRY